MQLASGARSACLGGRAAAAAAGRRAVAHAAPRSATTTRCAAAAPGGEPGSSSRSGDASTSGRPLPRRGLVLGGGLLATAAAAAGAAWAEDARVGEVAHSDEEWKELLSPGAYAVLRKAATEPPFTSKLYREKRAGTFVCAGCRAPLFQSSTKYESGTGWPSFYQPISGAVDETLDYSIIFMPRVEVRCHRCKGHLGHVFDDGPAPTGKRFCMNGLALDFEPAGGA